jgi:uncharacterized short protein YbdD (DUF466 family)
MFKKGLEKLAEAGKNLAKAGEYLGATARLMVGVPDYDTYVQHVRMTHPELEPMTYEEFFRERQDARYDSSKPGRCC